MKKNKIKNIATIMTVVLGTGILSTAETLNEGINLGDNTSNAIGSGSLATGRGTNAIGSNAFASGNNMTREQYEEFIKQNNARLKELESKMQEVASARGDLSKLEAEHQDIANKLRTIETYRNQIEEKERQLAEKEPILTREIEVKKGEKVSYRTQIEDLERRLNIIGQLDFSTINDSNRGQAIDVLAQDLKTKMENGVTFLSEYGENGIPVEEYKKAILKQIDTQRKTIISGNFESELYNNRDNIYNTYHDNDQEYRKKLIENDKYTYTDGDADGYRQINNYKKIGDIIYFNQDFYSNGDYNTKYDVTNNRFVKINNNTNTVQPMEINEIFSATENIYNRVKYDINKFNIFNHISHGNFMNGLQEKYFYDLYNTVENNNNTNGYYKDEIITDIKNTKNKIKELEIKRDALNSTEINEVSLLKQKQYTEEIKKLGTEIYKKYGGSIGTLFEYNQNEIINLDIPNVDILTEKGKHYYYNVMNQMVGINDKQKELIKSYYQNIDTNITQKFQAEIDRLKALEKDTQDQITIKENEITGYRSDITNLTNLLNGENPGNIDEVARQINEKKELIVNTEREIETLKANVSNVKDGENALANGTNSRALGKASISIGTNNYTNQESSIALGTNNTVNGEKSIAIGYGHNIQGNRNATLGDPNTIYGNDNFVIGNNITIGSEQNPVNNNLVFGSNINIQNVSNAIVLGNGSDAVENAVSVGKTGAERKIVNVADGLISETSKEAINGSQLYKFSLSLDDKLSKINLAPSTPKVDTSLINADIANALAIAGIPQVGGNKLFSLGAGTGYNAGQAAIALGISGQTPNKMFIFKLSGAVNLKKGYSVSAGVNINFGDIEDTTNKKLEREVLELRNKLKDLKVTNVTEVNGKNYDGDITKLENQNKDLVKSNESLLNAIKYLKNELDSLKTQTDTLKKQTTTDKTNIAEQPVIQHITLDNFDFDKYDLKREHLSELGKLDYNTIKNVVIVGHADERGSDEYNQKLSENRAKIVRDFIKDLNNKIDIYYLGKGKSELISTDQAKNRRVEISIK